MADKNNKTLAALEQALLKNGRAACPNPTCNQSIVTAEKEGRAGNTVLEYWCENDTCPYHKRRIISISIGKGLLEQLKGGFSTISKKAITGLIGLFLVIGATLGNYVPKWLGIEKEEQEQINEFRKENEALRKEIQKVMEQATVPIAYEDTSARIEVNSKDQRIAELEDEVSKLKEMMAAVPVCESDLRERIKEAERLMKADDLTNARKIFDDILEDPRMKAAFLAPQNNGLLRKMVKRMADSYSNSLNRFTYDYLKNGSSFQFFQSFLETFPVPEQSIYLGKAFYNYPNYTNEQLTKEEAKRWQLLAVQHYLRAARDRRFTTADQYIVDAINDILKLYRLFKYQYKEGEIPENYKTIEMAIDQNDAKVLQRRINFLQNLIDQAG